MLRSLTAAAAAVLLPLALTSHASAQFTGGDLPGHEEKLIGQGEWPVAGSMYDFFGPCAVGHFSNDQRPDVVTLLQNPTGAGRVYYAYYPANYDGVAKGDDPDVDEPDFKDVAAVPDAFQGGRAIAALTAASGLWANFYDYGAGKFVSVQVVGAPYDDAGLVASGNLGGGEDPDLVFSRDTASGSELVVLEDVQVGAVVGGWTVTYQNLRTIAVAGKVHDLCVLDYQGGANGWDEIALITSAGAPILDASGTQITTDPFVFPGGFVAAVPFGAGLPGAGTEKACYVVPDGSANYYIIVKSPQGSTPLAPVGPLAVSGIGVGDYDADGKPDLVVNCRLAENPAVFLYTENSAKPYSIANGGWIGGPGNVDADNTGHPALLDFDCDGDADVFVGDVDVNAGRFLRSSACISWDMVPGVSEAGGGFSPLFCVGMYDYEYDSSPKGGGFDVTLVQPATWPPEVPRDLTTARLLTTVWRLEDGEADADQRRLARFLTDLTSVQPDDDLVTIDVDTRSFYEPTDVGHDLSTPEILSFEIQLVEVSSTNRDRVVDYGPSSFLMYAGYDRQRDALIATYGLSGDDVYCAGYNPVDGFTGNDNEGIFGPEYVKNGCQNFGKPPDNPF